MENSNKSNFFWPSYADLMTSLFFIMLVLFVLTVLMLQTNQRELVEKNEELEKGKEISDSLKNVFEVEAYKYQQIKKMEEQLNTLKDNPTFEFLEECNKYIVTAFKGKSIFKPGKASIEAEFVGQTVQVGRELKKMLKQHHQSNDSEYFIIIEGNLAKNLKRDEPPSKPHNPNAYRKSYQRALAVDSLWRKNGIDLRKYGAEYLMVGSGFSGNCRDADEKNNKRFSIQIIPKINIKKYTNE